MKRLAFAAALAVAVSSPSLAQSCSASYYGGGERLKSHTASGERFRSSALTAAHRTLPFGTRVRVRYRGQSVVIRINDRGPAKWTRRCIDLSRGAAQRLGLIRLGHALVELGVPK